MRLLSAELENFCQFRHLKMNFAVGLTAIVGRNGSGKSNAMKGIYAAITGDFTRNAGIKVDNVSQWATAGATARVSAVISHGDAVIDVTRGLKSASTRLVVTSSNNKTTTITKVQEATTAITNLLGVSDGILSDYVFVDQWSIFDFLSMVPSERAKAFQRLFRTENVQALWKLVDDHHDNIVIPTFGMDRQVLTEQIQKNQREYDVQSGRLEEISLKLLPERAEAASRVLSEYRRKEAQEEEIKRLDKELAIRVDTLRTISREIDECRRSSADSTHFIQSRRIEYTEAKQLINDWRLYDSALAGYKMLLASRAQRQQELNVLLQASPVKPADFIEDEEQFSRDYDSLSGGIAIIERCVELRNVSTASCLACGAYREHARYDDVAKQRDALPAYKQQLEVMKKRRHITDDYNHTAIKWTAACDSARNRINDITQSIKSTNKPSKPDKDKEVLYAFVSEYDTKEREYKHFTNRLNDATANYNRALGHVEHINQELTQLQIQVANNTTTEEQALEATAFTSNYQKLLVSKSEVEGAVIHSKRIFDHDKALMAQLNKVEDDATVLRKWKEHCLSMRDVLHRDCLPKIAALNYLELMQDEINSLLTRFDSPFLVAADDSLSFTATFKDGRKTPAARLSGGEKVLLALAFRVVVNDIFARDLGLLVLDEPTAGLDEANIACMRIAIERLKELSSSRGLQVIIITHEKDMNSLFDHVIEIGK